MYVHKNGRYQPLEANIQKSIKIDSDTQEL